MKKYIVYTKEKGKIETDNWRDFECLTWHIEDGPAYQEFHDNGQLFHEEYYINGKLHRLDGPAYQRFYDTGQLYYESYYINGKMHRLDGPAFKEFYDNDKLNHAKYYINGKCYNKSDYDAEIFKMKLALL